MGKNENPELKRIRQARYREAHRADLRERNREQCKKSYDKNKKDPVFIGIDGEAHREADGRSVYSYLRAGGQAPLINRAGLKTKNILEYLFRIPPGIVICGFVLNYDWENWLRDIPDEAYKYLTGDNDIIPGEEAGWTRVVKVPKEGDPFYQPNTIDWEGYTITYYPKKIFSVSKPGPAGRMWYRKVLDVWGYCQASFVNACLAWGVATAEEMSSIIEGKEKRNVFTWKELSYIALYNEQELELMAKLANAIFAGLKEACEIAQLPISASGQDLYGPGAIARKLLKKTGWPNSLGRTAIPEKAKDYFLETIDQAEDKQKEYLQAFPIIASYFGGRIEAAATGRFKKVYDDDLHSAYPSAITRLPFFPLRRTWKRFLDPDAGRGWAQAKRTIGMYYVMWNFPAGWNWYPFPTRQKKYQNVYYPKNGQGWICSPELFAALDTIPNAGKYIKVYYAWTIPGRYGYGGGENPLPEELKSDMALLVERMYTVRTEAKAQGKSGARLALKLILVSLYGKLLQQVGVNLEKPGLFHDLVASWITSWTRAMIYRAIAPHRRGKNIIAIQTDGILTKKKLNLVLSPDLADWEEVELYDYRQLLPGLYDYQDGEKRTQRRRGMPKTFDFEKAWELMGRPGEVYIFTYRTFLARRLYLAQPYKHAGMLYQWPELEKTFRPDLGAKRGNPWADLLPGRKFGDAYLDGKKECWLKPKTNLTQGPGLPFVLKFDEPVYIPREEWELELAELEEAMEGEPVNFYRE